MFLAFILCCVAIRLASGQTFTTEVFNEDFEGTLTSWTMNGLWHQTTNFPQSGANALGYGHNENGGPTNVLAGDYDTGATTAGRATSPSFALGSGDIQISVQLVLNTECETLTACDFESLRVYLIGASTGTVTLGSTKTAETPALEVSATSYSDITFDGTVAADNYQIQFYFDSDDEQFNDHHGVRVDNLIVSTVLTGISPTE
jgi:hypothetical protein